jgi:hypothetical protein
VEPELQGRDLERTFDVVFTESGQLGLSVVREPAAGRTVVSRAIPGTQAEQ